VTEFTAQVDGRPPRNAWGVLDDALCRLAKQPT